MKELDPLRVQLEGTQLIEASAGTGKTYTITTLLIRLLVERRLPIENILVVTFTNAATAELRARVRRRIREAADAFGAHARGQTVEDRALSTLVRESPDPEAALGLLLEALRGVDEAAISTIHGFCQRVLKEHAFESNVRFDTELLQDQTPLVSELVEDFWTSRLAGASEAELRFLSRSGVKLDTFRRLAWLAVNWPEMPVVPPAPATDEDRAVVAYLEARSRALELWQSDRERIVALLSEGLDGRKYRADWLRSWCENLDEILREVRPVIDDFKNLFRFSTASIEAAAKGEPPRHAFFALCDRLLEARGNAERELSAWWLSLQHELIGYARTELARRKEERGVQSFDDLLQGLSRALEGPGGDALAARIRARLPAALIDEFQDTDPVQYRIFRKLYSAPGSSLFLIGDPKQAIYAFRGADVFAYLGAARDAGERVYTLGVNYRSDPALVRAVNTIFSRLPSPFLLEGIGFPEVRARDDARDVLGPPALRILFVPREGRSGAKKDKIVGDWHIQGLPRVVAGEIARLLASRPALEGHPLGPGDIAVLTRTNSQARQIQDELGQLSIPSVLHGDSSVLDSVEAEEIGHVLAALADPSDTARLRAALTTHLFGLGAQDLFQLGEREDEIDHWIGRFIGWHEEWERAGFVQAFHRVLREAGVSARLLALVDGERRLTNVLHLVELLHRAASGGHLGIAGLVAWFDEVRADEEARRGLAPDSAQIRLESDRDAVQLTTMHKSKGLEYAVVYCPYLWGSCDLRGGDKQYLCFHDPDDGFRQKLDLGPVAGKAERVGQANREALAEGLRLAYVALTRAKHHAVVVWGAFNGAENAPLAWLLHQPVDAPLHHSASQRVHLGDDRALRADLEQLVQKSQGSIVLDEVDESPAPVYSRGERGAEELEGRRARRVLDRGYRNSSFSALASTSDVPLPVPAAEGRDRDELAGPDAPLVEPGPRAGERVLLSGFPRGAKPGNLLHSILEHLDFQSRDRAAVARLVEGELSRHGFDAAEWAPLLVEALDTIVDTPLDAERTTRLRDVPLAARRAEMEFVFPVAQPPAARFTAEALARELSRHARALPSGYTELVGRLGFAPLSGFLRGFIDLVFEHDGRFFVVDYKSNHLGDHPEDYRRQRLIEAMAHHHYYLQYHLYAVALHRQLRLRVPGYDYERHFGGVRYLFLRGMSPAHPPGCGVFSDRPPRALIEGLDRLLDAPARLEARP